MTLREIVASSSAAELDMPVSVKVGGVTDTVKDVQIIRVGIEGGGQEAPILVLNGDAEEGA